jgi:DNA transformation protein and related proteins
MRRNQFVDLCLELLAPASAAGAVRARAMFGGHGLYVDDLFVAIVAFDRLFLKTDATTRPRFAAAGGEAFVYDGKGKPIEMSYWTVPAEAMESPALMAPWARLAMQAALAQRAGKTTRPATQPATSALKQAPPAAKPRQRAAKR